MPPKQPRVSVLRRTPLKRAGPPRKKRPGVRRGQPSPTEKAELRRQVYDRAAGLCELRLMENCSGDRVLPWEGDIFTRAHLVHLKAKRRFGWGLENLAIGCACCHLEGMHCLGLKPNITRSDNLEPL